MSRVFSRRPGFRFLFGVSDSSAVADRVLEERDSHPRLALEKLPAPQESSRSDGRASKVRLAKRCQKAAPRGASIAQGRETVLSTAALQNMGAGASAGEIAAAVAGECVFGGSVFADMACGMPRTALLWPCLLMPTIKGMTAGHQQALAAQAEQRRIRGR